MRRSTHGRKSVTNWPRLLLINTELFGRRAPWKSPGDDEQFVCGPSTTSAIRTCSPAASAGASPCSGDDAATQGAGGGRTGPRRADVDPGPGAEPVHGPAANSTPPAVFISTTWRCATRGRPRDGDVPRPWCWLGEDIHTFRPRAPYTRPCCSPRTPSTWTRTAHRRSSRTAQPVSTPSSGSRFFCCAFVMPSVV